jgi:hypothetical protein
MLGVVVVRTMLLLSSLANRDTKTVEGWPARVPDSARSLSYDLVLLSTLSTRAMQQIVPLS